ncbi:MULTISPECIES: NrdR family transcriptional regulator [Streptomyces]|uniref:NrdR family transcriptional regulator n=1 Tax=Streptomyces TaxID=1883 RepID=UPI0035AB9717
MRCPSCAAPTRVVAAEVSNHGSTIRRRRRCSACDLLFTTLECANLVTVPQCGVRVPFSRWSVITKVRTAAQRHRQVIDSAAHRERTRSQSLGVSHHHHLAQRRTPESSELGATSPFSLASASGRG